MIYEYNLTDHASRSLSTGLGNTRITFGDSDADGDAEILQENHYYPFGLAMTMSTTSSAAPPEAYLYNGKELQDELDLGWYDYGARMYDASIGRWNAVDPLAELYLSSSPYAYVMNNPLNLIDPTGMSAEGVEGANNPNAVATSGTASKVQGQRGFGKPDRSGFYTNNNSGLSGGAFSGGYSNSNRDVGTGAKISPNQGSENSNIDMAILVAYPNDNPKIPSNQGFARWWEGVFGDGDGKVNGAGHAGIVIIDGETGLTRYFDFGRYSRNNIRRQRGENEGSVRSSSNFSSLSVPNWNFQLSEDENVRLILTRLHSSPLLSRYGPITGALARELDFDAMLQYATTMENLGYVDFGGYATSSATDNATYCAKFARGVAGAGGVNFNPVTFTGEGNVDDVSYWLESTKITIP